MLDAANIDGDRAPVPLLIHIGYHKTGSTFLQRRIFDDCAKGFTTRTARPRHVVAQDFVSPDLFCFDADAVAASYLESRRAAAEQGLTLVISHERLAGYPANGGHDRALVADRLKAVFGDARILIVLREQSSMIRSMYSQYITDGGDQDIVDFLRIPEPKLGRMPYFRLEYYEYHHLIAYYSKIFGASNVLALPFEMLRNAPSAFLGRISRFCGRVSVLPDDVKQINDRRPLLMQSVQRVANRHFSRNELSPTATIAIPNLPKRFARLLPLFRLLSPKPIDRILDRRLQMQIAAVVGSHYEASNFRTSRMIGIDLAGHGYGCGTPNFEAAQKGLTCASVSY